MRDERDFARKVTTHLISHGRLKELARLHTDAYRSADPFPHRGHRRLPRCPAPADRARRVRLDGPRAVALHRARDRTEVFDEDFRHFGPITRSVFSQLNAAPFLWFLQELTGIAGSHPGSAPSRRGPPRDQAGRRTWRPRGLQLLSAAEPVSASEPAGLPERELDGGLGRRPGALGPRRQAMRAAHLADLQPRGRSSTRRTSATTVIRAHFSAPKSGRGSRSRSTTTRSTRQPRTTARLTPRSSSRPRTFRRRSRSRTAAAVSLRVSPRMLYTVQRLYASSDRPATRKRPTAS